MGNKVIKLAPIVVFAMEKAHSIALHLKPNKRGFRESETYIGAEDGTQIYEKQAVLLQKK